MQRLLDLMARLRDPEDGCPWDLAQSFKTILPHTIEEAYEVADAIERGEMSELCAELGDLLFQVVFYAQLAKEIDAFDFDDVARGITEKMIRRHPHVFAEARVAGVDEQSEAWERHKAEERRSHSGGGRQSQLDGVALGLPALVRAEKLQKRAAKVGFDWRSADGPLAKIREESAELEALLAQDPTPEKLSDELGDLLFSCVNLARHLGVDAESALRHANSKFERRFRALETAADDHGTSLSALSEARLDRLWEQVKREVDVR
ncbi:MAG: nucleoside triphosphate pyrophosphohydrolase [Gammaproteobacteria bacterium]|nr:nucleoside triphosphate pyrophosphohydrolase [Gammaproteobacteria bacterium]MCP5416801.1 nucleoside triphosphate pyrophosphohydrolase [Chromatiaceae bacterium]